jgi:hypothetical protein
MHCRDLIRHFRAKYGERDYCGRTYDPEQLNAGWKTKLHQNCNGDSMPLQKRQFRGNVNSSTATVIHNSRTAQITSRGLIDIGGSLTYRHKPCREHSRMTNDPTGQRSPSRKRITSDCRVNQALGPPFQRLELTKMARLTSAGTIPVQIQSFICT